MISHPLRDHFPGDQDNDDDHDQNNDEEDNDNQNNDNEDLLKMVMSIDDYVPPTWRYQKDHHQKKKKDDGDHCHD